MKKINYYKNRNKIKLIDGEIIKEHPEIPWYISNYGRIFSIKLGREKKYNVSKHGYLFIGYKKKTYLVHRLVAKFFIGEIPKGMVVNHIDGNKKNNKVTNLEIVTYSENELHAYKNKLKYGNNGEKNGMSKLTNSKATFLIKDIQKGLSNDEIAKKYGLHPRYVSLIRHKRRWKKLWKLIEGAETMA